jgi:AcrR family transcriptional regulator
MRRDGVTSQGKARRRTQEERKSTTIRKLLDAAADVLIDEGYAQASVQAVCGRVGLSQGGLFRHFATRDALMVAVADDVGRRMLDEYRRRFEALHDREDAPYEARSVASSTALALRLVRERCRSRLNQAWYELLMAARTHPGLRRALRPIAARYHDAIEHLARELLPDLAASLGAGFGVLVDTIVAVFDGEAVHRFVLRQPALEEARVALLLSPWLLPSGPRPRPPQAAPPGRSRPASPRPSSGGTRGAPRAAPRSETRSRRRG